MKKICCAAALLAAVLAPYALYPVLLMKVLCFALFACAFNLLIGYTGLLSFGHAAFFGGGAYVAGYALTVLGLPVEIALLCGTAAGALTGWLVGSLAIRRQGIYFTMITLALAQMLYFVLVQAPWTGGENGLQGVPRGRLLGLLDLGSDIVLYYVVLAIALGAYGLCVRLVHSPFGQVLAAIRQNEARATSLGYEAGHYKLLAFVLSAALSGLAGALMTLVLGFATLSDAHWSMSGLVVLMVLVGGLGTLAGPVVGAVVIVALENKLGDIGNALAALTGIDWFRALGDSVSVVTGLIFVACVLTFRQGIVGTFHSYINRRTA
ncbi:MAG: branched-chain amino acid ABC transporter permease [Pseudomonadota bacterium]